jgi:hypothetical protein
MSEEAAARSLMQFLADVGDAPEVMWAAAIAMMRRATAEAEEARYGRFRHYPQGQLRRLREDVARGMKLARLAAALQEADDERGRELHEELHESAVAAAGRRRREQTLPGELARVRQQKARSPVIAAGIAAQKTALEEVASLRRAERRHGTGHGGK